MASLNKIILIGNLTADPELKSSPSGVAVTTFRIGVARYYKHDVTDFINVVAWRKNAEFVCKYFKKGHPICVCGSLQTREYEKDGQKHTIYEVVADEVGFGGYMEKKDDFIEIDENAPLPF